MNNACRTDSACTPTVATAQPAMSYEPAFDLIETESALVLRADVPGVKPEGVDLTIERGELRLLAKPAARHAGARALREEFGVGDYHLSFTLPRDVDAANVTAALSDGVLTVTLPKPAALQPRRIAVTG